EGALGDGCAQRTQVRGIELHAVTLTVRKKLSLHFSRGRLYGEAVPPEILVALSGLGLGLSLIVAIGSQNAFVLRQGLRRERVALVVLVCVVSDVVLIGAGVAGAGAAVESRP